MQVPLTRSSSFPHNFDGIFGAAKVMLRPAAEGTGVIAGEGSGRTPPTSAMKSKTYMQLGRQRCPAAGKGREVLRCS